MNNSWAICGNSRFLKQSNNPLFVLVLNLQTAHDSTLASYADDLVLIREELGFAGLRVYWQIMEMLHLHDGRYPLQSIMALKCKAFSAKKIQHVIELASSLSIDKHFFVCIGECIDSDAGKTTDEEPSNVVCSDFPPSKISEQNCPTHARIEETREKKELEEDETLVRYSNEPWYPYVVELLQRNNSWHEVTCMQSGYGRLLCEHWHEAIQRRGVRICVFDPLNSFRRGPEQAGMSDLQWYLHVCNTMLGFAHRNDVLVILVAHPRKVDRSMLDNRKRRVEMNDISGSSDFGNKCDFCICIDRDDDLQVVTAYVDKVKFKHLGTRGQVHLHYDPLSGRYVPCTLQKLSEQDFLYLENQPRRSGEQLLTIGTNHYKKNINWRHFNIRWIDEQGNPLLAKHLDRYEYAENNNGQMGLFE